MEEVKELITKYVNENDVKEIRVDIYKLYNKKVVTIRVDGKTV